MKRPASRSRNRSLAEESVAAEAEAIRDAILAASGQLTYDGGSPPFQGPRRHEHGQTAIRRRMMLNWSAICR